MRHALNAENVEHDGGPDAPNGDDNYVAVADEVKAV